MRPIREIAIPDALWEPLGRLATALGTDREALVAQALHALLRFHGAAPGEPPAPAGPPRAEEVRRVLDTAADLERTITPGRAVTAAADAALTIHGEHGLLARVEKDRFLIGRGRHCDLVLDSAKVSREHAVIRREADGWWIEDLGSSNGTWHQAARVDRRRIADGDEFAICAERLRCVLS